MMARCRWPALAALLCLMLSGCATDNRRAELERAGLEIQREVESGRITRVQAVQLEHAVLTQLYGRHAEADEYYAYAAYVAAERDAGRMTRERAIALLQEKMGQLRFRQAITQPAPSQSAPTQAPWQRPTVKCESTPTFGGGYSTECR